MSFDLAKLDTRASAQKGAEIKLRHPVTDQILYTGKASNDETYWKLRVVGHDSKLFQEAQAERSRDIGELKDRGGEASIEEAQRLTCRMLARCVLGWENIHLQGKPFEFNFENAVQLFLEYPWIREQVDRFIINRANFLD